MGSVTGYWLCTCEHPEQRFEIKFSIEVKRDFSTLYITYMTRNWNENLEQEIFFILNNRRKPFACKRYGKMWKAKRKLSIISWNEFILFYRKVGRLPCNWSVANVIIKQYTLYGIRRVYGLREMLQIESFLVRCTAHIRLKQKWWGNKIEFKLLFCIYTWLNADASAYLNIWKILCRLGYDSHRLIWIW